MKKDLMCTYLYFAHAHSGRFVNEKDLLCTYLYVAHGVLDLTYLTIVVVILV